MMNMPVVVKNDPYLWGFSALLVVVTAGLIWHGSVSFREGGAFIIGALSMPALLGRKDEPPPPAPPPPPPPPSSSASKGTIILGLLLLVSCAGATPQEKATTADSTFAAEMQACVANADTVEKSHACRAVIRAKWDLDGGAP